MRRLLAAAILLGACAAAPRRAVPPPAEQTDVEQLYVELRNRELELRNRTLEERGPLDDCSRRKLRDNICALADRICRIAEKEPPGSRAAEYCSDGKARCAHATELTRPVSCKPSVLQ